MKNAWSRNMIFYAIKMWSRSVILAYIGHSTSKSEIFLILNWPTEGEKQLLFIFNVNQ